MQNKLETLKGKEMWKLVPFVARDSHFSGGKKAVLLAMGGLCLLCLSCLAES